MTEPSTPPAITANDIKIALLENNEVIFSKMNEAIEKSGKGITTSVEKRTDTFITNITKLAEVQGSHTEKLNNVDKQFIELDARYSKLWAKIGTVVAISNIIVGAVVYLIVGGHVGH